MAVQQEFFDLFIPIPTIEIKIPGGWHGFIKRWPEVYASGWHDWHLFRQGALHSHQINDLIAWWEDKGFIASKASGENSKCWVDLCVSTWGKPTHPCSWIAYDKDTGGAYLKGTEPGELVGPEQKRFCTPVYFSNIAI